ncbi:MAG: hypothetical protein JNN28_00420 [Saprospiraceae bacterium]|nr:hypothetical protein [Saprospiraceae bacterium]
MKARFFIICFLAIVISQTFSDCKEPSPTIVKGKVVDYYTQEPLEGVEITIYKWHKDYLSYRYYTTIYSDSNGYFEFGDAENPDFRIGDMRKLGYVYKDNIIYDSFDNYQKGAVNEAVIPLFPNDCWLNLQVDKVSSGKSKIYLSVYSPILKSEIGISLGKVALMEDELELTEGQTYAQFLPVASNEMLTIYWDFKPINLADAFRDSVFVTRGDTSAVTISY